MTRVLAMLLLGLCLAVPARAQDAPSPEALRAAQNLAALVGGDTTQQMSGALVAQMWGGLEAQLRGELERLLTKFVGESLKEAPAIYARHFTVSEMNDLMAFYRTPTGAKALRELPKVTAETLALVVPRMASFQQEVAASVQAILQKHGYK